MLNITNGFVRLLQSDHETSCVATAWIDHYSMLAVFFWVAIPSYELTFTLRDSTGCLPSENSRSIDQRLTVFNLIALNMFSKFDENFKKHGKARL